ncbi:MAG: helix-turn-helix domain-containing protein [Solirubrobacterales bacterium]|nr:helix-turn-helix domain-containing protein [Solirubrobacterales bacterium]
MAPSEDVQRLIAQIAEGLLDDLEGFGELIAGAIVEADPALGADPAVRRELTASSRANAERFLTAMAARPGEPAPPDVPPEALDLARTFVRRGIELETLAHAYRRGQNAAWGAWMERVLEVAPPAAVPELLTVSSSLLFAFVDAVLSRMISQMEEERAGLLEGAGARRERTVRLLLDGAPLGEQTAGRQLGYALDRHHTAFVAWTDAPGVAHGALERVAEALAEAAGAPRALTVTTSTMSLWGWIGTDGPVDVEALRAAAGGADEGVRVAAGASRPGIAGFRRSHDEAIGAQGLLAGSASPHRFVSHHDVDVIALLGRDDERLRRFVTETLGPLCARDATTTRMRDTVRLFLQEGDNAARAAERLGTHRNTVLHRIARAEELLGHPLRERRLALGVALEADFHLGITARG